MYFSIWRYRVQADVLLALFELGGAPALVLQTLAQVHHFLNVKDSEEIGKAKRPTYSSLYQPRAVNTDRTDPYESKSGLVELKNIIWLMIWIICV